MLFYHVTVEGRLEALKRYGIRYNFPIWKYHDGRIAAAPGYIYAFKSLQDALRWALKTQWEFDTQAYVVTFEDVRENWREDANLTISLDYPSAYKKYGSVESDQIVSVELFTGLEQASRQKEGRPR